jgi:hypothetical protein
VYNHTSNHVPSYVFFAMSSQSTMRNDPYIHFSQQPHNKLT